MFGKKEQVTLLPRQGFMTSSIEALKPNANIRVNELVKGIKSVNGEEDDKNSSYFRPGINSVEVNMLYDHTKANSMKKATLLISDKSIQLTFYGNQESKEIRIINYFIFHVTAAWCKLFEHYLDFDFLVVVPNTLLVTDLYKSFNAAACNQLELGFHGNIVHQLGNSITAEKPEPFHFWPSFAQHFITVLYPEHTSEEKLSKLNCQNQLNLESPKRPASIASLCNSFGFPFTEELRHELHDLFFVKETRPYFRRPAAVFQSCESLLSPHVSLRGKYSETAIISGHYEYKHYMQVSFNDDGWGCAYRSLQSIVSWFRLQGFTSRQVPTHREIQECLVSLLIVE